MELLDEKLSLFNEIYSLTESIQNVTVNEKFEELEDLLEKRQNLMKQIDDIDNTIKNSTKLIDDNKGINDKIQEQIKKIIDIDEKTKLLLSKKEREFMRKFTEIDTKIKTKNYDLTDSEKRPKGYYLNKKS